MSGTHVFGSVDDVDVALGSLEVTATGVTLRLHGVEGERTAQLDAEYRAAFEAWAEVLRRSRDEAGDPPTQPGTRVLTQLPISLTDDAGTRYVPVHGQSAGSGTEWLAEQRFEPVPPAEARCLTVKVGAGSYEHRLD